MRDLMYVQALNEAIREEMARDDKVFILGEEISSGLFGTTAKLIDQFGKSRVIDTPISECMISGSCIGSAVAGYRPIAEMMMADFAYPAFDEICGKIATWMYMHGRNNNMTLPIVLLLMVCGYSGQAAEHSRTPIGYYMNTPGSLKIAYPSTPYDAKGLLKTAIRDNNPVVFFESMHLMQTKGEVPENDYTIPFGVSDIKRNGTDVSVVAVGYMVSLALQAADALEKKGISVEVIDPRTLRPLDIDTIVTSVKKTGRAVVIEQGTIQGGVQGEIACQITERAFDDLKVPVKRAGAANTPIPYSPPLEKTVLPSVDSITDAIESVLR